MDSAEVVQEYDLRSQAMLHISLSKMGNLCVRLPSGLEKEFPLDERTGPMLKVLLDAQVRTRPRTVGTKASPTQAIIDAFARDLKRKKYTSEGKIDITDLEIEI